MSNADLTIYPQNGTFVPGAHLNIRESQHVQRDWMNFAVSAPEHTAGMWNILIVFHTDTGTRTTHMDIPRSARPVAVQRMAVAA